MGSTGREFFFLISFNILIAIIRPMVELPTKDYINFVYFLNSTSLVWSTIGSIKMSLLEGGVF